MLTSLFKSEVLDALLRLPPLHPLLVNFTAALVPASFAADVLGRVLRRDATRQSLRHAAWWTLLLAALVTPATAVAGWWWKRNAGMGGGAINFHMWLGFGLAALFALLATWRGSLFRRGRAPGPAYLVSAGVLVALLALQGHLGAALSFGAAERADADLASPAVPADSASGSPTDGQPPGLRPGWSEYLEVP